MTLSCDCSIDTSDYDAPEFSRSETRKARKPHTCLECGEVIQPGEQYECDTGKWEGRISTIRTCIPCSRIRQDYCGGGWIYGGLVDQIADCLGFDYRKVPA